MSLDRLPVIAVFSIEKALLAFYTKYGIDSNKVTPHQYMVANLWIAKTLERIFILHITPHPCIYTNTPLTITDLSMMEDCSFDTLVTTSVSFNNMYLVSDRGGIHARSRISVTSLVLEV